MHIVKLLSVIFLALYLIVAGFAGIGAPLVFVPKVLEGLFALISGVLFLVWAVKSCWIEGSCDKT